MKLPKSVREYAKKRGYTIITLNPNNRGYEKGERFRIRGGRYGGDKMYAKNIDEIYKLIDFAIRG